MGNVYKIYFHLDWCFSRIDRCLWHSHAMCITYLIEKEHKVLILICQTSMIAIYTLKYILTLPHNQTIYAVAVRQMQNFADFERQLIQRIIFRGGVGVGCWGYMVFAIYLQKKKCDNVLFWSSLYVISNIN